MIIQSKEPRPKGRGSLLFVGKQWSSSPNHPKIINEIIAKCAKHKKETKDSITIIEIRFLETSDEKIVNTIFKKNERTRIDTKTESIEFINISDGKDHWIISPWIGKQKISAIKKKRQNKNNFESEIAVNRKFFNIPSALLKLSAVSLTAKASIAISSKSDRFLIALTRLSNPSKSMNATRLSL
jgi:hypothetical protein